MHCVMFVQQRRYYQIRICYLRKSKQSYLIHQKLQIKKIKIPTEFVTIITIISC